MSYNGQWTPGTKPLCSKKVIKIPHVLSHKEVQVEVESRLWADGSRSDQSSKRRVTKDGNEKELENGSVKGGI